MGLTAQQVSDFERDGVLADARWLTAVSGGAYTAASLATMRARPAPPGLAARHIESARRCWNASTSSDEKTVAWNTMSASGT